MSLKLRFGLFSVIFAVLCASMLQADQSISIGQQTHFTVNETLTAGQKTTLRLNDIGQSHVTCQITSKYKCMAVRPTHATCRGTLPSTKRCGVQSGLVQVELAFENTCKAKRNWYHIQCQAKIPQDTTATKKKPSSPAQAVKTKKLLPIKVIQKNALILSHRAYSVREVRVFTDHLQLVLDDEQHLRIDSITGLKNQHFADLTYWQQGVLRIDVVSGKWTAEFVCHNPILRKAKETTNSEQQASVSSTIAIPFRLEATKHAAEQAKGAFYDHYLTRAITGHPTALLKTDAMKTSRLQSYQRQLTYVDDNTQYPACKLTDEDVGLLLIPGMARQSLDGLAKHCQERRTLETDAIRTARRRGQPILGICAGSWRVWQVMGEANKQNAKGKWEINKTLTVEPVQDHVAARMPYLRDNGQGVAYNMMVHDVIVPRGTMLADAMDFSWHAETKQVQSQDRTIPVNSVHWQSPKSDKHKVLKISATASGTHGVKLRTGAVMAPQQATAEAFESQYGAPVLGVQWHFEAFYGNPTPQPNAQAHLNILRFMAKAGDSYGQKRKLIHKFHEMFESFDR